MSKGRRKTEKKPSASRRPEVAWKPLAPSQNGDRQLFPYFNGSEWVYRDPVLIDMALCRSHIEEFLAIMKAGTLPERWDAYEQAVKIIHEAFQVNDHESHQNDDGKVVHTGLTRDECWALFWNFDDYLKALKKNMPTSPTSAPSTEQGSSVVPSAEKKSLPSGSSATEQVTGKP
jgi:hypothetical protein